MVLSLFWVMTSMGYLIFTCYWRDSYYARICCYPQSPKSLPFALEMCAINVPQMLNSLPFALDMCAVKVTQILKSCHLQWTCVSQKRFNISIQASNCYFYLQVCIPKIHQHLHLTVPIPKEIQFRFLFCNYYCFISMILEEVHVIALSVENNRSSSSERGRLKGVIHSLLYDINLLPVVLFFIYWLTVQCLLIVMCITCWLMLLNIQNTKESFIREQQ